MMVQYNPSKQNRLYSFPEGWMEKEITPFWEKSFGELQSILLDWLQGARSVWVFSYDDPFNALMNSFIHENYFNLEGHDILIVRPDKLTVEFLHAAFFWVSPIEIFKTNNDDHYIKDSFRKSILPKGQRLRDSDFSLRVLYDSFGEFITVEAMAYLYRVEEKDLCQNKPRL